MSHDPDWHQDHNEIVAFVRWMHEERAADARQMIEILEKPWKWNDEFGEYAADTGRAKVTIAQWPGRPLRTDTSGADPVKP